MPESLELTVYKPEKVDIISLIVNAEQSYLLTFFVTSTTVIK